jgi:hypothetical protein
VEQTPIAELEKDYKRTGQMCPALLYVSPQAASHGKQRCKLIGISQGFFTFFSVISFGAGSDCDITGVGRIG